MSSKSKYKVLEWAMHIIVRVAFQIGIALFAMVFILLGHELINELITPAEVWTVRTVAYDIALLWLFGFVIDQCVKTLFGRTIIHSVEERFRTLLK